MRAIGLTACLALLALAAAAPAGAQAEQHPAPPLVAAPDDALTHALESGELSEAEYALERARSIFQLNRARREFGYVVRPEPQHATLILRDLAVRADELAGADRGAARRLLARPGRAGSDKVPIGDGWTGEESVSSPSCGGNVCIHWVEDGNEDAPPAKDWVDRTLETWEDVWFQEIDTIGYRAPLSDFGSPNNGGDERLDVYLDDLGSFGVFGYCTSDDPAAADQHVYAVSAYCVIDNDFAPEQYGDEKTPLQYLEVTSAHEFHHASQFAYDWLEDYWMMEGTAANVEETVYPGVDDNVTFLRLWSPLTRPGSPLDRGGLGNSEYGAWIFWRYLQEKVAGGDPAILREIWERADAATPASPDDYSLQAVQRELSQRGLAFADAFVRFGVANRRLSYADAKKAGYPSTPTTDSWLLRPSRPATGWRSSRLDHLATRYFSFAPGLVGPDARLRLRLDLPRSGARAALIVVKTDGSRATRYVKPSASSATVRFGRGEVARVDLVLSNGSTSTDCWTAWESPTYSCLGTPRADNRAFGFKAELVR